MPPRIIESPWIQKIVNSAVWSSQCSNIKVIPLGKAERIMQELLTQKDKEREEAVAEERERIAKKIVANLRDGMNAVEVLGAIEKTLTHPNNPKV